MVQISLNGNKSFTVTGLSSDQITYLNEFFSYKIYTKEYDYKKKKYNFYAHAETFIIPEQIDIKTLKFPMGYIFSFMNVMYPCIDRSIIQDIVNKFKNTELEIKNYYDLEDRNDTYLKLNTLLKYKRGIIQIPTASGKTEIIATLVRNIVNKLERVLIISETTPALDELRLRLRKLGVNIPDYFDKDNLVNVIKPTGFCRNGLYNEDAKVDYFNKVKYLIADEVETTVTPSFNSLFNELGQCEYFYGFSASANKNASTEIPKDNKLKQVLNVNVAKVVQYYGFTAIDARPENLNIIIKTANLNLRIHPDLQERNLIIRKTFNDRSFHVFISDILRSNKTLYIPINSTDALHNIIADTNITRGIKTLMVSGNGYQLFNENNYVQNLNLDEAKYLVQSKEIKLVLGTSSSYRAIDFHGIEAILVTFEKQSAILRQCIGRLTRGSTFEVYLINPVDHIPYLSSAYWTNYKEIKDYYGKCKLKFIKI